MFKFYDYIFGASYLYYANRNINIFPRFGAIIVVILSQMLFLFLIFALIKKITVYDIFLLFENKIYLAIALILWGIITVNLYSKKKVQKILNEFSQKSNKEKAFWNLITAFSIIIPLIGTAILLKK
jgi:SNF family Na+-dependent transporter